MEKAEKPDNQVKANLRNLSNRMHGYSDKGVAREIWSDETFRNLVRACLSTQPTKEDLALLDVALPLGEATGCFLFGQYKYLKGLMMGMMYCREFGMPDALRKVFADESELGSSLKTDAFKNFVDEELGKDEDKSN